MLRVPPVSFGRALVLVLPFCTLSPGCSKSDAPTSDGGGASSGGTGGTSASRGGANATGGSADAGSSATTGGTAAGGSRASGGQGGGGSSNITGGAPVAGGASSGTNSGGTGGGTGGVAPAAGASGGPTVNAAQYVYVSGSKDISIFALDAEAGTLSSKGTVPAGNEATYLAIAPDRKYLYAINEQSPSRVIAFSIDSSDGGLTEINRQDTTGDGSPHLAVHPSGKWVVAAHYGSGHITVLSVRDDGGVGQAVATSRGPDDGCEKAHQAVFDETGGHLYVPCLGSNYVIHFTFAEGELDYGEPPTVTVAGGPRHMALHPTAPYAYVLSELESTLTRFAYDRTTGQLSAPASIPSFDERAGSSAHVVVHPSGKFLYVSNRTENSLGLFSIDATTGTPSPVSFETAMISTPRDFAVDPTGRILISANQAGEQDLLVYRLDPSDGRMTRLRAVPVGGRPSFVGFVSLP